MNVLPTHARLPTSSTVKGAPVFTSFVNAFRTRRSSSALSLVLCSMASTGLRRSLFGCVVVIFLPPLPLLDRSSFPSGSRPASQSRTRDRSSRVPEQGDPDFQPPREGPIHLGLLEDR